MGKRMNDLLLYATPSVGDSHNHRGAKKEKADRKNTYHMSPFIESLQTGKNECKVLEVMLVVTNRGILVTAY